MKTGELQLNVFGGLTVLRGQESLKLSSQKALALLCYLGVNGQAQPRPVLAGLLWGGLPDDKALMSLRKALTQLRPQVGEWLNITRQQVNFIHEQPHRIDAKVLTRVGERYATTDKLADEQLTQLEQAVELYQGEFLEGFYIRNASEFEQWMLAKRAYYHDLALQMLRRIAEEHCRRKAFKPAISFTRRLLQLEPWRERSHGDLMRYLALNGQRGAALAQYELCREVLQDELGVTPSEATEELYQAIEAGWQDETIQESESLSISGLMTSSANTGLYAPRRPAFLNNQALKDKRPQPAFVCRERHLDYLERQLETAISGQGRVVMVTAEAGMGKTSLLAKFSARAQANHPELLTASGVCTTYTGHGDPYLPFREILQTLACDLDAKWEAGDIQREQALRLWQRLPVTVQALATKGPNLISALMPGDSLVSRAAAHEQVDPALIQQLALLLQRRQESGLNQEYIFEEYAQVLTMIAAAEPLLLILDDLHWADRSSINLLFHLGQRLINSPVLIVGAYRPEDVYLGRNGEPHPVESLEAEFKRLFGNNRLQLEHGKWATDRQFVDALLDTEPNLLNDDFRAQLTYSTRGQPLFTIEMLREMQERGDISHDKAGRWVASPSITWDALPERVEGVIEKRINRLEPVLRNVLRLASVEGEEFSAEVIAAVNGVSQAAVIRMLSQELAKGHRLVQARSVIQAGGRILSRYRFVHNLFQKYLYSSLDPVEKVHLHRAVGEAMEDLYGGQTEEIAVHLSHHFQEAHLSLKAAKYLLQAGRKAIRLLAYEEASRHIQNGFVELEGLPPTPEVERLEYDLHLVLAQALWHAGRVQEVMPAYRQAIEAARDLKDGELFARAVLAYEEPRWRLNLAPELSQRFIREALGYLGEAESGLKVRLLVSLARSLLASGEQDELVNTVEQALRLERRIDDPLARCDALRIKIQIDRRPQSSDARLAAIQEMIATAEAIGDQERLADALDLYVYDLLEMGQIELVDQVMAAQSRAASEINQPFQLHVATVFQTMRAILDGEFTQAEQLAKRAAELSRRIGLAELDGIYGIHMFTIRREQGRLHELAPLIKAVVANSPGDSAWRPGLALMLATLDLQEECRELFEALAADGFVIVPQDALWVATLAYLAEVCAYLGDSERAAMLYEYLLPYDGRTVVVGGATACFGAVARYLGILAGTNSNWEAAERHFQAAIGMDSRLEAWPWLAHGQFEYAAMLIQRGYGQDQERINSLLAEARRAAKRMGMADLIEKIAVLATQGQPQS